MTSRGWLPVALGLLLLPAMATTCSEDRNEEGQSDAMPAKTIGEVLKEHTDSLMSLPGVVGTAQGEREGKPCIKVLVAAKTSALVQQIPSTIEGYRVEVVETGEIHALDPD